MGNESDGARFDVDKIANLARIALSDELKHRFYSDMARIVDYVDMLAELDVSDVEPTSHAVRLSNVVRDDVAIPSFSQDEMLANAPDTVDGELIKVPAVIDQ